MHASVHWETGWWSTLAALGSTKHMRERRSGGDVVAHGGRGAPEPVSIKVKLQDHHNTPCHTPYKRRRWRVRQDLARASDLYVIRLSEGVTRCIFASFGHPSTALLWPGLNSFGFCVVFRLVQTQSLASSLGYSNHGDMQSVDYHPVAHSPPAAAGADRSTSCSRLRVSLAALPLLSGFGRLRN